MTDKEVMQMALDALESSRVFVTSREKIKHPEGTEWYDKRIEALRTALAQLEPEPVAWMYDWTTSDGEFIQDWTTSEAETLRDTKPNIISNIRPLYTAQREWVGLTHKEHMEIMTGTMTTSSRMAAVEAKLKEKNT